MRCWASAATMAAISTLTAFLLASADAFFFLPRAMNAPYGLMSSSGGSSSGAIKSSIVEESSPSARSHRSSVHGGRGSVGEVRKFLEGVRGGINGGEGKALSASAVDAVGGEVVDVLGPNKGVLSEEQQAMAATLVELGQVGLPQGAQSESECCCHGDYTPVKECRCWL